MGSFYVIDVMVEERFLEGHARTVEGMDLRKGV
jgi:hypothetical protein